MVLRGRSEPQKETSDTECTTTVHGSYSAPLRSGHLRRLLAFSTSRAFGKGFIRRIRFRSSNSLHRACHLSTFPGREIRIQGVLKQILTLKTNARKETIIPESMKSAASLRSS